MILIVLLYELFAVTRTVTRDRHYFCRGRKTKDKVKYMLSESGICKLIRGYNLQGELRTFGLYIVK